MIKLATEWPAEVEEATHQPSEAERLDSFLAAHRFDIKNPPPRPDPYFIIGGQSVGTPGNIVVLAGQVKSGKSAAVIAMLAAIARLWDGDCLGFESSNPAKLAVVHLDSEQAPADHFAGMMTALRRSSLIDAPDWLRSYSIAAASMLDRRKIIRHEMEQASLLHGGIHSLFLDGVADFMASPNDEQESILFVDELHQLAIKYSCVVVCVLHENPGSEIGKTRGHLGSQLERKAESNLRLAKDGEVVTLFSEKCRHASISREKGPRFQWNDEQKMHISVIGTAENTKKEQAREALQQYVEDVFGEFKGPKNAVFEAVEIGGISRVELIGRIMALSKIGEQGARTKFDRLRNEQLIKQGHQGAWRAAK